MFSILAKSKKYILFKQMIIAMKKICAKPCFHARPSNKKICCLIFVLCNIDDWLHHSKIFFFKTKKSIVARYEFMNSLKISSTIHKTVVVQLVGY